jgi:hypothetical protein
VFLWSPRTGGTSVSRALASVGCYKFKTLRDVRHEFSQTGLATFGHQSYGQLVDCGAVSREYDAAAWKFAFVRNPWDRAVSLFAFLKRRGLLDEGETFADFARRLQERRHDPVGLYTARRLSWCNPQVEFLRGFDGQPAADFIGRFESLGEDLAVVARKLGLAIGLMHLNAERHEHYREMYDDTTRALVGEAYAEDIETFGYKF